MQDNNDSRLGVVLDYVFELMLPEQGGALAADEGAEGPLVPRLMSGM